MSIDEILDDIKQHLLEKSSGHIELDWGQGRLQYLQPKIMTPLTTTGQTPILEPTLKNK